jgi:hypothetical protein
MYPMGFEGFSISKLSTIAMNNELMFLLFKYACSSACTSAAWGREREGKENGRQKEEGEDVRGRWGMLNWGSGGSRGGPRATISGRIV